MVERTCSVDGCDLPHLSRGWCRRHYERWKKYGDPLAPSRLMSRKGTCAAETCDKPIDRRGYCRSHYRRLQEYGDPLGFPEPAVFTVTCAGCGQEFQAARREAQWCSSRCRSVTGARVEREARQAARETSACLWCGQDIANKRADARYCSDYCSNRVDYRDNRDRIASAARRYIAENPEKVLASGRRYRDENREKIYARQKAWQQANLEHHKNYQREYRKKYALANADKKRLQAANRYARKRSNGGGALVISERDWRRMLVIYRSRCAYCRGGDGEVLHMEHVIPLARGGRHAIGNVVPACARCNQTKSDRLLVEWRNNFSRRRRRPTEVA